MNVLDKVIAVVVMLFLLFCAALPKILEDMEEKHNNKPRDHG